MDNRKLKKLPFLTSQVPKDHLSEEESPSKLPATLDFDREDFYGCTSKHLEPSKLDKEINKYVDWVDSVLEHHKGSNVDQMIKVYFDLDKPRYKSSIVRWTEFAEKKRVRLLELSMLEDADHCGDIQLGYITNSHQKLHPPPAHSDNKQHKCSKLSSIIVPHPYGPKEVPHPCAYSGLKYVKFVHLMYVPITVEGVHCFLKNCPFLEQVTLYALFITYRTCPGNLIVGPSSISLKYLRIELCSIPSIEICDSKLVSFTYVGRETKLRLWTVPLLTEVSIEYYSKVSTKFALLQLLPCQFHLKVFKMINPMRYAMDYKFPEFENLNHLELRLVIGDGCCLLQLASFVKAAPCLQSLVLKLASGRIITKEVEIEQADERAYHHSLRTVEVQGYCGRAMDTKLVMYLIENAVELEKIIILPALDPRLSKGEKAAREDAIDRARQQFEENVPPNVQLVWHDL